MVIDRPDLENTHATLGVGSPELYSDYESFACAKLLINFQRLSPSARVAWTRIQAQHKHEGSTSGPFSRRQYFYVLMLDLKNQAFGPSLDGIANCDPERLVSYPWSLTDGQFQTCMLYIRTDQIPDADKLKPEKLTANEKIVVDVLKDKAKDELIDLAKAALGTAIGVGVEGGPVGAAAGFVVGLLAAIAGKLLEETTKRDLIRRYDIDERRRLYLAGKGMSSYVKVRP
jgi:hypothetical protein